MKKVLFILSLFLLSGTSFAEYVSGYYKSNGTYVSGYNRNSGNGTVRDNYSYKGNNNPYTGSTGTNTYKNNPSSGYYVGH